MSEKYSELANWNGAASNSRSNSPSRTSPYLPKSAAAPVTQEVQRSHSDLQPPDVFFSDLPAFGSSDDSLMDEARIDKMLQPSSPFRCGTPRREELARNDKYTEHSSHETLADLLTSVCQRQNVVDKVPDPACLLGHASLGRPNGFTDNDLIMAKATPSTKPVGSTSLLSLQSNDTVLQSSLSSTSSNGDIDVIASSSIFLANEFLSTGRDSPSPGPASSCPSNSEDVHGHKRSHMLAEEAYSHLYQLSLAYSTLSPSDQLNVVTGAQLADTTPAISGTVIDGSRAQPYADDSISEESLAVPSSDVALPISDASHPSPSISHLENHESNAISASPTARVIMGSSSPSLELLSYPVNTPEEEPADGSTIENIHEGYEPERPSPLHSDLSPEIPLASLPLTSEQPRNPIQTIPIGPPRTRKRATQTPLRDVYVLIPPPPATFVRQEYITLTSATEDTPLFATSEKGRVNIPTSVLKRKRAIGSNSLSPRKRARQDTLQSTPLETEILTELYENIVGRDVFDAIFDTREVLMDQEIPYVDPELELRALRVSLRHFVAHEPPVPAPASKPPPSRANKATSNRSLTLTTPLGSETFAAFSSQNGRRPKPRQPKRKQDQTRVHSQPQPQPQPPPQVHILSPLHSPKAFVMSDEYIAAVQHYSASPAPSITPGISPDSLVGSSQYHNDSRQPSPAWRPGDHDVPVIISERGQEDSLQMTMADLLNQQDRVGGIFDSGKGNTPAIEAGSLVRGHSIAPVNSMHSFQDYLNMVPWPHQPDHTSFPLHDSVAEPSPHAPTSFESLGETTSPTFGDGTIDPSMLGGAPPVAVERSSSPVLPENLSANRSPSPESVSSQSSEDTADGEYIPSSLSKTLGKVKVKSKEKAKAKMKIPAEGKAKGRAKIQPSDEVLAAAGSGRRREMDLSSPGVEKRSTKPSARVLEALASVDHDLTDADAEGETIIDDFDSVAGSSISRRVTSPVHNRLTPSHKQGPMPKVKEKQIGNSENVNGEIPLEYCHQCRNKNSLRKMRCCRLRENGLLCGLIFCERCVEKRYPQMVFDPSMDDFICPKCGNYCNCTACCAKRGETYISSRGNGPSPFLHSATAPRRVRMQESHTLSARPRRPVSTPGSRASRPPSARIISVPPEVAIPSGMFWGAVYGVDGQRIGMGILSQDQQVIVTGEPLSSRKVLYIGKPPSSLQNKVVSHSISTDDLDAPIEEAATHKKAYVGRRGPISDSSYRSLEEHLASASSPLSPRSSSPLTPLQNSSDPAPQLDTVEMGFLLAQALQVIHTKE